MLSFVRFFTHGKRAFPQQSCLLSEANLSKKTLIATKTGGPTASVSRGRKSMQQPTALCLGADARTIPRKKGLLAEYFYEGEPVVVTSTEDLSMRSVGVVLSLTGDFQMNAGVMRIGIGQGREVHVPYTDVPSNVSKLLGFYCILGSGVSEATNAALRPHDALEHQTSQQSLSIEAEAVQPNLVNVGRQHVLGAGVPDGGFMPMNEPGVSVAAQLHRRDSEPGELQQLIGLEISRSIQPKIEKISHDMSMMKDRMTAEIVEQVRAMLTMHNRMDADIEMAPRTLSAVDNRLTTINEHESQTGVDSTSTYLSEIEQAAAEFTQEIFETGLASWNQDIQVTRRLLSLIKQMNQLSTDPSNITDPPSSISRSDLDVSHPENMSQILSETNVPGYKTDEEMDSFLRDQAESVWSRQDVENLAKLFLNVCHWEMDAQDKKNCVDELLSKARIHDVGLLSSDFASWLQTNIPAQRNSQGTLPKRQGSLLKKLFSKILTSKTILGSQRSDKENLDACVKNGMQVAMISKPFTIWNAVGSFGSPEGKTCWHVVRMVLKFLIRHGLECPWMNGSERGVFGETPLHVALLFNNADETDWRFHEMFNDLWNMCPRLHDAQYQDILYEGENVLHLAIIRNFGSKVIEKILLSHKKKELLMQQAVGSFFKIPSLSYGFCNLLGEYPHFFAACSNQIEIFQLLVAHGADLEHTASEKKYNLLHVMILNDSSIRQRSETSNTETGTSNCSCKVLEHFKKLAYFLKKIGELRKLEEGTSSEGYTPLMLAAAKGSVPMFLHLFDDERVQKAWSYGALVCKKLYLDGVDVPLNRQGTPLSDSSRKGMSLLEILVLKKRKDILSESEIDKLVQMKWDKYGCFIFHRKLGVTLFVTVAVFLLPMTKIETSLGWKIGHIISHTVIAFVSEYLCEKRSSDSLIHRFIFRTWSRTELTTLNFIFGLCRDIVGWIFHPILPVTDQIEAWAEQAVSLLRFILEPDGPDGSDGHGTWFSLYGACIRVQLICDRMLALCRQWHENLLDWDAEQRAAQVVPLFSRVLLGLYVLRVCFPQSCIADVSLQGVASLGPRSFYGALYEALGLLNSVEALLYSVMGLVSFASVASLAMVFRDCGSFVLLLNKAVSSELPVFIAVYVIFLLCFAHAHFLASNQLHAGLAEGADSVWRIFSAMLGNFSEEKEELVRQPWNYFLVSSITVTNYFLVAVVSSPHSTIFKS